MLDSKHNTPRWWPPSSSVLRRNQIISNKWRRPTSEGERKTNAKFKKWSMLKFRSSSRKKPSSGPLRIRKTPNSFRNNKRKSSKWITMVQPKQKSRNNLRMRTSYCLAKKRKNRKVPGERRSERYNTYTKFINYHAPFTLN